MPDRDSQSMYSPYLVDIDNQLWVNQLYAQVYGEVINGYIRTNLRVQQFALIGEELFILTLDGRVRHRDEYYNLPKIKKILSVRTAIEALDVNGNVHIVGQPGIIASNVDRLLVFDGVNTLYILKNGLVRCRSHTINLGNIINSKSKVLINDSGDVMLVSYFNEMLSSRLIINDREVVDAVKYGTSVILLYRDHTLKLSNGKELEIDVIPKQFIILDESILLEDINGDLYDYRWSGDRKKLILWRLTLPALLIEQL